MDSKNKQKVQERGKNLFLQKIHFWSIIQWIVEISWCWDLEMEAWPTDCYSQYLFSYVKLSLQNQFVLFDPVRQQIYESEETDHFSALQSLKQLPY